MTSLRPTACPRARPSTGLPAGPRAQGGGGFRLLCVLLALCSALSAGDRIVGRSFATRSEVLAQQGAAATNHPLATQIAISVLQRGGSAVDAAIAANAALGVMEPQSCGLGGDLFALVWIDRERRLYSLNASGRSPHSLTRDEFRRRGLGYVPGIGPLPVTVPGCADGWAQLHRRFGRLPFKDLLEPAARYARNGFPVTPLFAHDTRNAVPRCGSQPNFLATYAPNGSPPAEGSIFRNTALADTLEALAREGPESFYRGSLARALVSFCERSGCYLRAADLGEHSSSWVEPVSTNYRGYDVWTPPPNSQGMAALQLLNILEHYDLRAMGHNSIEYLHHLVEAKKIVYADVAHYYAEGTPVQQLLSKEYAANRRRLLGAGRASRAIPAGPLQSDTVSLAVADRDHNMVSLVQSNFAAFGSGMVPDGMGFLLQNRGSGFRLEDGHPNGYAPRKRPFHTLTCGFVTRHGRPFLSFGVMGGEMQTQAQVQVLLNILEFGMNAQEAGDAPRFRHNSPFVPEASGDYGPGELAVESGIPMEVQRGLVQRGHLLRYMVGVFGGYQAILYDAVNNVYHAASESRTDGAAEGY